MKVTFLTATDQLAAIRPATPEALAEIIHDAAHTQLRVRLVGSDSLPLTIFGDDPRPVQAVSIMRLNKLIDHAAADMTVTVQAGMTLEALQKHLAWRNQWLPVDPPVIVRAAAGRAAGSAAASAGSRTLGGMIASNALGPLRFGSGDWRLLILGMRWVDATGTLIKGGGRTVKNVAGYSTPRMMIGSAGSFGAIAEVTLRTFARPEDEHSILFYCSDAARAETLLAAIFQAPVSPAWLEAAGSRTFAGNPLQLPAPASGIVVIAGFLGRSPTCEAQIEILRQIPAARRIESITQGAVGSGRLRQWMTREPAAPDGGINFRLFALPSQAACLIGTLEAAGAAWVVSEAGSGMVRGMAAADAGARLAPIAAECGARMLVLPTVPGRISADPLYRRLKHALDPGSLFGEALA